MASFKYRAINDDSRVISGNIEASDEDELDEKLNAKGLTLIEASKRSFTLKRGLRLNEKDLLSLTYFLNLVFSSGMPITGGLKSIARQTVNSRVSGAASALHASIESGKSISDSMLEHPHAFPSLYISMIKAGELSGNLEQIFKDIMSYLNWQIKLKKDVNSAIAYPAVVLSAVIAFIIVLFTFVLPKFIKILSGLKVSLPMPTKILIFLVDSLKEYWPMIIISALFIPFIYKLLHGRPAGKRFIDLTILKTPLIGELVRKFNYSKYFKTFATLFNSGLNMSDTLQISSNVIKNSIISDSFNKANSAVLGGEQFSKALINSGDFPPLIMSMVEIGEETGTLGEAVVNISDIYDKEIPETLNRVFFILEPLMLFFLGAIVLLVILSFFLPLYRIIGGIR